ncbi:MAG: redox-regulated ATPase YchF [Candidatus Eremiobacteraeota bacterium]|nr:redox-regulated ATPase YchF [Candidatus Eremiobacteraeota bacterium]
MSLAIGITGLAQAGKSTLFSALTALGSEEQHKKGGGAPRARAAVPDLRVAALSAIFKPKKTTPTQIDFIDMPGGSSGGLGAQALGELRTSTALVEVVRCFDHPYLGAAKPTRDMEDFEMELMLADLKIVEGKLERKKKLLPGEQEVLEKLQGPLADGRAADLPSLDEEEKKLLSGLGLLSLKPRIFAANLSEDQLQSPDDKVTAVHDFARSRNSQSLAACALLEAEISQLPEEERAEFMESLGIEETGLSQMVRAGYQQLGLMTFFTVGEDEVRAWTTDIGATAPQAAGEIHSDLQRGFIRAEVIHYDTFMECGSLNEAKNQGKLRVEGKEYIVVDGDILNIRFNV